MGGRWWVGPAGPLGNGLGGDADLVGDLTSRQADVLDPCADPFMKLHYSLIGERHAKVKLGNDNR